MKHTHTHARTHARTHAHTHTHMHTHTVHTVRTVRISSPYAYGHFLTGGQQTIPYSSYIFSSALADPSASLGLWPVPLPYMEWRDTHKQTQMILHVWSWPLIRIWNIQYFPGEVIWIPWDLGRHVYNAFMYGLTAKHNLAICHVTMGTVQYLEHGKQYAYVHTCLSHLKLMRKHSYFIYVRTTLKCHV